MGSTITQWDGNLLMEIQHFVIHEGLTPLVKFITHLGDAGSIWIALILLMLCFKKTRRVGVIAATALILSFVVNNLMLKNLVGRIRPYEMFTGVQRLVDLPLRSFGGFFCDGGGDVPGTSPEVRRAGADPGIPHRPVQTVCGRALSAGCALRSSQRNRHCAAGMPIL